MVDLKTPNVIPNIISNEEVLAQEKQTVPKLNPHNGQECYQVTASQKSDVDLAFKAAAIGFEKWSSLSAIERGQRLFQVCQALLEHKKEIAEIVALETGKTPAEALGEVQGAIMLGQFFAAEGQRLYGKTTTHSDASKRVISLRQPCGIAGLIIAANTPIANVAWKVFPALICGNSIVLKAAEDTPATAWAFAKAANHYLPSGALNVIQGLGIEAGAAIVDHPSLDVISFTGSSKVGKEIAEKTGKRLIKTSMELGGKNPLVVCEDADLENAVKWSALSSFSNAGQRCAASSRIIVVESVYEDFKKKFLDFTSDLKMGHEDGSFLGPVINERQLNNMLAAIEQAKEEGASILIGGQRSTKKEHTQGFYMEPTILENVSPDARIANEELFGPVTLLFKVKDYKEALSLANRSAYGLTACIHTSSLDKAMDFALRSKSGTTVTNAGTYGSQPHMPFGGVGLSGNGSREPGTEALDIYSELKTVILSCDKDKL